MNFRIALENVQQYLSLWNSQGDAFPTKAHLIARKVLKIGMVSAAAWTLKSINANTTFLGFSLGAIFFYSPIREIFDDFTHEKLSDAANVAQGVVMLIARLAPDLIPWGITLSVFSSSCVLGVYTRELITPKTGSIKSENANRFIGQSNNDENRGKSSKELSIFMIEALIQNKINSICTRSLEILSISKLFSHNESKNSLEKSTNYLKNFILKIYSISLFILGVFSKSFLPTLFNWTLSFYNPNASPCGFWVGFVFHRYISKQWDSLKQSFKDRDWVSLGSSIAITSILCYFNKNLVQKIAIFSLSALMGRDTYVIMYTETH